MRIVALQHRVKKTRDGEARPTKVIITEKGKKPLSLELEDETAELDFVFGIFPITYREAEPEDDVSAFKSHHLRWQKATEEEVTNLRPEFIRQEGKQFYILSRVPASYDGLQAGDQVAMVLGGSGDPLSCALARHGATIGAKVFRIPPFFLKLERAESSKEDDATLLARLLAEKQDLFYETAPWDLDLIVLRESWRALQEAMKARIACDQRLRQQTIGQVFTSVEDLYPEGGIEGAYDSRKASDTIFNALLDEEAQRDQELKKAIARVKVFADLLNTVEGVGPRIAARIISAVIDIRRFPTKHKLVACMGVHVLPDGRFARRRGGAVANWHPDGRQALYLVADQWVKRPDSKWGKVLREYKVKFRETHPVPVVGENGKKKYTNGHIHKMAIWRTITKFARWLWKEWTKIENQARLPLEGAGQNDVPIHLGPRRKAA